MTDSTLDADISEGKSAVNETVSDVVGPGSTEGAKPHFWSVFLSTFITIFLAELGDKTQVTTLLISAESQSPWTVFIGAALALISTSLLGVLLGRWLSTRVSPQTLDMLAAILLLVIAITLMGDVMGV
ncbi:MAG: TMEM165/GDT1 family protein [Cyanobacteria bacterium J06632_22]